MSSVLTTASPERAEELRQLIGDPADVAAGLARLRESGHMFSSDQPRLIDKYVGRWIAVFDGRIVDAESLDVLLARLDEQGVARERVIVRLIDQNERILIL